MRDSIRSGAFKGKMCGWPSFVYGWQDLEPGEIPVGGVWDGFFRSPLLVTVSLAYKHVFTSPSSLSAQMQLNSKTQPGDRCIYGLARVSPCSIAYIAMQVRFALGSRRLFTLEDALGMSSRKFYELTTEFFDKSAKDIEMQELLAWWDEQIFPATENLLICPQSRRTNKGKDKASDVPTPIASDDEDVDMASDASMDFKEIDESDDSGSEFVVSEEEDEAAFVASDSDEEALMLSAAAEMSLQNQTALPSAASGSSQRAPTNKGAALAAERRMGRANKGIDVNDY
ncbi:hypothetical protein DXG01_012746, partial [Tephrocybe rancida]